MQSGFQYYIAWYRVPFLVRACLTQEHYYQFIEYQFIINNLYQSTDALSTDVYQIVIIACLLFYLLVDTMIV